MKPIFCAVPEEILNILNDILGDEEKDKTGKNAKVVYEDDLETPFADDSCPYSGPCDECPYEKKCAEDLGLEDEVTLTCEYDVDVDMPLYGIPDIDRVVFSGRATIIFWEDGTKTVVKCMEGEKFERYAGFAAACMKKMFGSTSRAKSLMEYFTVEEPVSKKKKKKNDDPLPGQMTIDDVIEPVPTVDKVIQEAIDEALAK